MEEKWRVFEKELELIKDSYIREFTKESLNNTSDYFFIAQASSTGKYHPTCTIKKGGLIVHVKRVIYLANRLCTGLGIEGIDKDIILSACILHDIAKTPSNDSRFTYADYENHPINAVKYLANYKHPEDKQLEYADFYIKLNGCIQYHMGLWTPKEIKKDIKNYSLLELVVYISDYIAATKDLITPEDIK